MEFMIDPAREYIHFVEQFIAKKKDYTKPIKSWRNVFLKVWAEISGECLLLLHGFSAHMLIAFQ